MKYVLWVLSLMVLCGSVFAQVDDTLCRSSQWAQVDAWIIFIDDGSTKFVKCFKWSVLQPVWWNMIYEDVVNVDTSKLPTTISGLDSVGTSLEYGSVYRLPAYRQQAIASTPGFVTASVDEETTWIWSMIALVLVWLLLVLWGMTVFTRKSKD